MDTRDKIAADLRAAIEAQPRLDATLDSACRRIVMMLTIEFDAATFDAEEYARCNVHFDAARAAAIDGARTIKRLERLVLM